MEASRIDVLPLLGAAPAAAPDAAPPAPVAPDAAPVAPDAAPPPLLEQLVRDPAGFAARLDAPDAARLVRGLLGTLAFGAGVFGAVVGAYRGGRQVLYCAAKLPLVLIGTLVVCAPAFVAIARATRVEVSARGVVALALGASARFALVLAGLAPVLWLAQGALGYHSVILATVAACVAAGLAACGLLFRGLAAGRGGGLLAGLAFVAVYAVVGGHTAWLLRPYVVRPRTADVPFVRPLEGDLLGSVRTSARSAAGIYDVVAAQRRPPAGGAPASTFELELEPEPEASEPAPGARRPVRCEVEPCD